MRENHLIGITPAGDPDYQLLRDAGLSWLREGFGFPFESAIDGPHKPMVAKRLERAKMQRDRGFRILGQTPTPGSSRFDPGVGRTRWMPSLPESAGSHESDSYYDFVEQSCREIAALTVGLIEYWVISNEPDIGIFRGPLNDQQIVRFINAAARGLKKANPALQTGINLGGPNDDAKRLAGMLYRPADSLMDFIGLDGYFGSWQRGGPQNWSGFIDEAYQIAGRPIIIAEWGYSSLHVGPVIDDRDRKKLYNQDVCQKKMWNKHWRTGHTPQEQADYVSECVGIFAEHPQVIGNFFFRYGDTPTCWQCGQPHCPAECAWGMVDVLGLPKPAYYALRDANASAFGATCRT